MKKEIDGVIFREDSRGAWMPESSIKPQDILKDDLVESAADKIVDMRDKMKQLNQEIKDFVGGNGVQGAADGSDGLGVAGFGDFDVVVVDFLGRVVAGDEGLEGGVGDEKETNVETFVGITFAHFGEQAIGGLRGDHEAIRGVFVALLERNHEVLAHFGGGHNVRDEGDGIFKAAGVKVRQAKDARPVAGGLLFVLATFALDFGFVHGLMWLRGVWARGCGYV